MASGSSSPDDILQASPGKTNFTRLAILLVCGGTRILRELFDHSYSPTRLPIFLKMPATEKLLKKLRSRKILSLSQWKVLYPISSTCGESKSFDITLLVTLIREFCILTPPITGWDNLPADHDLSLAADVARIKYYRNTKYAHVDETMELSDDEFNKDWSRLKGALIRIVKSYAGNTSSAVEKWEKAMTDLRNGPITDEFHIKSIGNPQAELAMESRYFHNFELFRQSLLSDMEEIADRTKNDIKKEFPASMEKEKKSHLEVTFRCVLKSVSLGAVVTGTAYIFFRYKDDPEELRKMIQEVILPVGLIVGTIAIGSIKIGLRAKSLEELLRRYKSGELQKDLEQIFMTEELRKATNGEVITFSVEMNENDYRIAYCEMLRVSEDVKGKKKTPLINRLQTKKNRLRYRLNKWIDRRREVVMNLYDLAANLKKLKVRVKIAKAGKIFDVFFWPVLVLCAGAVLAYYVADGDWIMAAISTVLVAVVIFVVAVFGATAFKDSLRSFFLTELYDLETRERWPPGSGKNSTFRGPYDYVPRQEVASELRASQTTRTRNEDVRELIMDIAFFRKIILSIQWEQEVIAEVHSSLGILKGQVKCLTETETRSLASEHEYGESSSAFDKPFQIEDILGSFALPQPDIRAYVGSLMDNHQDNISKVVEKLKEMAENLQETCLKKDEAHDIVEKYLDELFIVRIYDARIRSKKL